MSIQSSAGLMGQFDSFGRLLRVLRLRARLTQRELGIEVGYSEAHISRIEHGHRPPDMDAITVLFVPALCIQDQPQVIDRFIGLAARARGEQAQGTGPHNQLQPSAQNNPALLVETHCALGTLACLHGQPDQALEHFQQAVELARKAE